MNGSMEQGGGKQKITEFQMVLEQKTNNKHEKQQKEKYENEENKKTAQPDYGSSDADSVPGGECLCIYKSEE